MTASPTPWSDALDTLEERLRRQESAMKGEAAVPPTRPLPEPDGPLPAELRPRAMALLERCRTLEAELGEYLATAPRPSAPVTRAYSTAGGSGRGTHLGAL